MQFSVSSHHGVVITLVIIIRHTYERLCPYTIPKCCGDKGVGHCIHHRIA